MATPRQIDHLVVAVRDLETARTEYARLGFTVTPVAHHPFGTSNAVVQFGEAYLELVAVTDPALIPEPTDTAFSFGAFNRRFLQSREGLSMLALHSEDAARDRADFDSHDLPVFDPLHFSRLARGPEGEEREVAFSIAFTADARMPDAGFFTCQHHFPENFWSAAYQRHQNGAIGIAAVVLVARDPADYHEFLTFFTGQHDMRSDSFGLAFDLGGGRLEVMSPVAAGAFFGVAVEPHLHPRFIAMRIAVADIGATRAALEENGVRFGERLGALVVPPEAAAGVTVAFVAGGAV